MDAVIRKYNKYQDSGKISENFIRHYYDLYCLLDQTDIQNFIGTKAYQIHKKERLKKLSNIVKNHPAFFLSNQKAKQLFEREYIKQKSLYYKGQILFRKIIKRLGNLYDDGEISERTNGRINPNQKQLTQRLTSPAGGP